MRSDQRVRTGQVYRDLDPRTERSVVVEDVRGCFAYVRSPETKRQSRVHLDRLRKKFRLVKEPEQPKGRMPKVGDEVKIHVCPECGFHEGARPQAGCCPNCGSRSGRVAVAIARVERYAVGDYWSRG